MTREQETEKLGKRLEEGIILARKRMLHEKALHGQNIILGDGKGGIVSVPAKDIIAQYPMYQ